jgi:Family of unknown function (DUF6069)
MSTISATTNTGNAGATRIPFRALLRVSLLATVLAAAATEALTAVVRAAGVHLAVGNPGGNASSVVPVNAGACAITIAMVMVIGTAIAALINRLASNPARTYLIATSTLVLVSLAAPLTAAATTTGSKLTLIAVHLVAAGIIVPLVGRRLAGAE